MISQAGASSRRRWHRKSRTGCQKCRSKKIKCDEQHPSCMNCIKKGLTCDFLQAAETRILQSGPEQDRLELELLHHFTVSTSSTLSAETYVRDLWRVVIPQMGFSTDYILDGIFALAALHVARHNEGKRAELVSCAIKYHTASVSKALPLIPAITAQNCSQLFVFGVLTLFFCLAKPIKTDDILIIGNGVVPEWLYLLRGIDPVVRAESALLRSPVAVIFESTSTSFHFWQSHDPQEYKVLAELKENIYNRAGEDQEKAAVLTRAITTLQRSYTFLYSDSFKESDRLRGLYTWLFEFDDEYLQLLKDADEGALCVLAFYSVVLKELEKYWWVEGWAVHLIRRIYMLLDGEHRLWVRWPIEEIGWIPESVVS